MSLPIEEWKDIPGYKGLYQVSSLGRVKSLPKYHSKRERILKGEMDKDGYIKVVLCPNSYKREKRFVHRIVAMAFIENGNNGYEVDLIDGYPSNYCIDNLRWVTHKTNINNPVTIKRKSERSKGRVFSKSTLQKMSLAKKGRKLSPENIAAIIERNKIAVIMMDLNGNELKRFNSMKEASKITGVNGRRISDVCLNKRNKAGGYKWRKVG